MTNLYNYNPNKVWDYNYITIHLAFNEEPRENGSLNFISK